MKALCLYLIIYLIVFSTAAQQPVGKGWAGTSVNTVIFRKNAVVTHDSVQYVSYYDSSGHVVLAKRKLGTNRWTINQTPYQGNVKDAHNAISIMVDGDGFLHLAWDHHNNPLNYTRSVGPGSLELLDKMVMTGKDEKDVTYPEFHRLPSGDLIFLYRSGVSGRGNLVVNRYNIETRKWSRVQDVLIDGEGERNAYWQFYIDLNGTLHLSWVWRETYDVATNHDLCYARSKDEGRTWEKSTGELYKLPITEATAEYAMRIPQSSELINQTSMAADAEGKPYIATYWRDSGSKIPQYYIVYHSGKRWEHIQVGNRTSPFSLSGGGTKKIPISRPQLLVEPHSKHPRMILIFRDIERGNKVSMAINRAMEKGKWEFCECIPMDLSEYTVGDWEPTYDTELWKEKGLLHLFVQRAGQGDGEKTEELEPQPVYVINCAY